MGLFESAGSKAIHATAAELKKLANAQRTHVGRVIFTEPVDISKISLPAGVTVTKHPTGFLIGADPDEHVDAVKR